MRIKRARNRSVKIAIAATLVGLESHVFVQTRGVSYKRIIRSNAKQTRGAEIPKRSVRIAIAATLVGWESHVVVQTRGVSYKRIIRSMMCQRVLCVMCVPCASFFFPREFMVSGELFERERFSSNCIEHANIERRLKLRTQFDFQWN